MKIGDNQMEETQGRTQITSDSKEMYPDLFLTVAENHRISDHSVDTGTVYLQITIQWYWWN